MYENNESLFEKENIPDYELVLVNINYLLLNPLIA